jgi:hypothetical protein
VVLAGGGEHDDGDLGVAEHGELARLLHDPRAALGVGDLPVGRVLDPLDLDLAAPHLGILGQQPVALLHGLELLAGLAAADSRQGRGPERSSRERDGEEGEMGNGGGKRPRECAVIRRSWRRRRRWCEGGGEGQGACVQFGVGRTSGGARRGRGQLPNR